MYGEPLIAISRRAFNNILIYVSLGMLIIFQSPQWLKQQEQEQQQNPQDQQQQNQQNQDQKSEGEQGESKSDQKDGEQTNEDKAKEGQKGENPSQKSEETGQNANDQMDANLADRQKKLEEMREKLKSMNLTPEQKGYNPN